MNPALLTGLMNAYAAPGNKAVGTAASGTAASGTGSAKAKEPTRAEKKAAQEQSDTIAKAVAEAEAFTGAKFSQEQIDAALKKLEDNSVSKQARDAGMTLEQFTAKLQQDALQLEQAHQAATLQTQAEMDDIRSQLNDLMTAQAAGEEVDSEMQKILTARLDQLSAQADQADTDYQEAILGKAIGAYQAGLSKKNAFRKVMAQIKSAAATEAAGRPKYKKRRPPSNAGMEYIYGGE